MGIFVALNSMEDGYVRNEKKKSENVFVVFQIFIFIHGFYRVEYSHLELVHTANRSKHFA